MTTNLPNIADEDGDDATLETLGQCADALRCSVRQVYNLEAAGELVIVRAGRSARVSIKSRKEYVKRLIARAAERRVAKADKGSEAALPAKPPRAKAGRFIKGHRYAPPNVTAKRHDL